MKTWGKIILIVLGVLILIFALGYISNGTFFIIKKQAGEASSNPSLGPHGNFGNCKKGLVEIGTFYKVDPYCLMGAGGAVICSDCGNDICEDWENKCNCPEDCKTEDQCIVFEDCPVIDDLKAQRCDDGICYY